MGQKLTHGCFLTGLALLVTACSSEGSTSDPAQQLAALEGRFLDAFNKGDAAALAGLFAADGVRVISGAQLPSTGRDQIQKLFEADIAQHNANRDNRLVSETRSVRDLGAGVVVADGGFELKDKDGAALLGGKWGCVYRQVDGGLEVVMESAHVAKHTLEEPVDFTKVEQQQAPAPELGDAAPYVDAVNEMISDYAAAVKSGDAKKIAAMFTEDGVQLVGSSTEPHRGRAAIADAAQKVLAANGYTGTTLTGQILGINKVSDNLLCANGRWQVAGDDGAVLEFGQWGNLMEIQDDGSLLLVMESAGPLHVAK